MPLAPDFKIKAGRYKNDTTGEIGYFCNCPGSKYKLPRLAAERAQWSVWPAPTPQPQPQGASNAGQTV